MPLEGDPFALAKVLKAGSEVHDDNKKAERHMREAIRVKLSKPGAGRTYETGFFTDEAGRVHPIGHRPPHKASRAGQAPAMDTGHLLKSMKVNSSRIPFGAILQWEAHAEYATYLEFGTSKMRPRPFMRPLAREQAPKVRNIYRDGIVARESAMARRLGGTG